MHPPDCPQNWEYKDVPNYQQKLTEVTKVVLITLRRGEIDSLENAADTRQIHQRLFNGLTPPDCDYFAGHYRGEAYKCLKYYRVGVPGDPRVGAPPEFVQDRMKQFRRTIETTVRGLDVGNALPDAQLSPADKLLYAVAAACQIFELFLRIHPYTNGNGHAARFCLTAILWRFGYRLRRFPVDPQPGPPYIDAIKAHRSGNPLPLEKFILECIVG